MTPLTRQQRRAAERAAAKLHYVVAVVPPLPGMPPERRATGFMTKCGPPARASDGTLYFLSTTVHNMKSEEFTGLDGTLLSALYLFSTLDDAKAWVEQDMRQRAATLAAEGQVQ